MQINANSRNTFTFGQLSKSKLTPFRRVFCETFHPPLEKMNEVKDLTTWVEKEYMRMAFIPHDSKGIWEVLESWKECIEEKLDLARNRNSIFWKYLIFKNLVNLNSTYVLSPKLDVIVNTIDDIKKNIHKGTEKFNFYRQYADHIKEIALKKYFPNGEERTGWIGFVGQEDPIKQDMAVDDIRALSVGTNWCTLGNLFSRLSIESPNHAFTIFLKDGKTVYGVRSENNYTAEIRNKHNEAIDLPDDMLDSFKKANPNITIWKNNGSMLDD